MTSGMRDLTIDELDAVSGGTVHTEVRKTTLINRREREGNSGGRDRQHRWRPALPSAEWIPIK